MNKFEDRKNIKKAYSEMKINDDVKKLQEITKLILNKRKDGKIMYIYDFYNFDYDESMTYKLEHEKKFSKEEFENIVNKCRKAEIKNREKANKKVSIDAYLDTITDEEADNLIEESCEMNSITNTLKLLKEIYRFKELKFEYTFIFNGGFYGKGQIPENRVVER